MTIPDSQILADFFRRLAAAQSRILITDYDGTLAPFRVEREQAVPYPGVAQILDSIAAGGGRVVVITGRNADDLPALLGTRIAPEIWGAHGLERRHPDGHLERQPVFTEQAIGLEKAQAEAVNFARPDRVEVKHGCLALHWRGLDAAEREQMQMNVAAVWLPLASKHNLRMRPFDGGLELRVPGADKGNAVGTLLQESPDAVAAYLGDDLTDEDAFKAIKGRGLAVLVRAESPDRPTASDIRLAPPDELLAFLRQWQKILAGDL